MWPLKVAANSTKCVVDNSASECCPFKYKFCLYVPYYLSTDFVCSKNKTKIRRRTGFVF